MTRRDLVGPRGLVLFVGIVLLACAGCDNAEPSYEFPAFLDVPWPPYNYANPQLPAHFRTAPVLASDNTPAYNPTTNAGATLGRILFYDTELSSNRTISCASCHVQELGFADPARLSMGFQGVQTRRNSPGLANSRFYARGKFFRDERAMTLEDQVLMPIQDPIEMGLPIDSVVARVSAHEHYRFLFGETFGTPEVTGERVARALAQFVRSMVAVDSRFDEGMALAGKVRDPFPNFTEQENLGKSLFLGRGLCSTCHMKNEPMTNPLGNAAIFFAEPANIGLDAEGYEADYGLEEATGSATDRGKFKAPSLRNIALTGPYMHDGRMETLEEVVEHYDAGVVMHPNLDERLMSGGSPIRLGLTAEEKSALVAFMETLTDNSLLDDAKFSDPFVGPTE